jgi:mono/diheme cytochrome c family protein
MRFRHERRARPLAIALLTLGAATLGTPIDVATVTASMAPKEAATNAPIPSSNPSSGKPEAIVEGRKLYGMWCSQCHGPKADGVSRFGKYAGDLRVFWRGYREFVIVVKDGRTGKQMPPWKEVLDDAKIAQIGAYLETLAEEGANWK